MTDNTWTDRRCPICQGQAKSKQADEGGDVYEFKCDNCGRFKISGFQEETLAALIRNEPDLAQDLPRKIKAENAKGIVPLIDGDFIDNARS